ncbi:dihydroorotase [Psittacicella gerlachiana]|uniref:Dihydroorotase n=1 Tax=Psittacicella gerlachiana TaxID=2028574 RepID=A0A3A1YNP1_9GAMM|nr:dihydroorotase [Psittacicella gerlachiana]RIY38848.1 dihydroorotase [Psittacicella gerlachiana]
MLSLLQGGKVLLGDQFAFVDILINQDKIEAIGNNLEVPANTKVYQLQGKIVAPGFIDVHVHWREPGFSYKETIAQASRAAARGGFTTAMPMPNLNPVPDTLENLQLQLDIIAQDSVIRALPYGAITKGELGKDYADFEALAPHVFAFSDDGRGVQDANMMYQSMKIAAQLNKPIVAHCEENSLILGGCMHCGQRAKELGLPGIPSVCESVQIARDVLLAEATGCHYHVCHLSTKESVRVVREAKKAGIKVTCEVCPHHLISNEFDIPEDNGMWKMNPPLRAREDQQALIEGLLDGTIDIIATDHAPHAQEEKDLTMTKAAFGIVGSETAFAQLYTHFVQPGIISLEFLLQAMSTKVAKTFNLPYGEIKVGSPADLVVIDLEKSWEITPEEFLSKGRNTPYRGEKITALPVLTIANGKVAYQDPTTVL